MKARCEGAVWVDGFKLTRLALVTLELVSDG